MYLIKIKGKEKNNYLLVVIDKDTNVRCKRYVSEDIARFLVNNGIKLYENIFKESEF